jgi:hypothetical protein
MAALGRHPIEPWRGAVSAGGPQQQPACALSNQVHAILPQLRFLRLQEECFGVKAICKYG